MKLITPIIFIEETTETNNLGDQVVRQYERKTVGNKVSIGSKEFYEAQALGLKPEIKVEIRTIEYNKERKLKLDTKIYTVIKVYDRQEGITELTLACQINNANDSKRLFLNGIKLLDGSSKLDGNY